MEHIYLNLQMVKEAVEEVCAYRCKWAVICDDKQKLHERHCKTCGITKLVNLLNGGDINGWQQKQRSKGIPATSEIV